jgi:hypothetical protein
MAWMADTYEEAAALLGRLRSELPERHNVIETLQRALDRCAQSRNWLQFAAVDWSDHDMVRRARLLLDRMDVRASLAEAINRAQHVRGECRAAMPDDVVASLRSALNALDQGGNTLDAIPAADLSAVSLWKRQGSAEPWEVWKDGVLVARHVNYYDARGAVKELGGLKKSKNVVTLGYWQDEWMISYPSVDKWGYASFKAGTWPTFAAAAEKVEQLVDELGMQPSLGQATIMEFEMWA